MAPHGSRSFLQRCQRARSFPALVVLVWTALACSLLAAPVPTGNTKPDSYPSWWFEREVIPQRSPAVDSPVWPDNYPTADDFAAVNLGQLKQVATAAYDEFKVRLLAGPSPDVDALIKSWFVTNPTTGDFVPDANGNRQPLTTADNFAVINLGQLKAVAQVFYDQLIAIHYSTGYPWSGNADDFAVANLGQLKYLFSFDLTFSTLGDGVPDWWKLAAGLNPNDPNAASSLTGNGTLLLANGHRFTYVIAYQMGYDPTTAATSDPVNDPVPGQGDPVHQLGTTTYAAIDVSTSYTHQDVHAVAIDDNGKIGFNYNPVDSSGFGMPTSASFYQGNVTPGETLLGVWPDELEGGFTFLAGRGVASVNATGHMAGFDTGGNEYGTFLISADVDGTQYNVLSSERWMTIPDYIDVDDSFIQVNIGNSGRVMGWVGFVYIDDYGSTAQLGFEGNNGVNQWFLGPGANVDSNHPTGLPSTNFYPSIFSPGGIAAGLYWGTSSGPQTYAVGTFSAPTLIGRLKPLAVNDDWLVLGDDQGVRDNHDCLSVWDGNSKKLLSTLLPSDYQNKIRFPRGASEAWLNTSGDIVVSAEMLNQIGPASTWAPCTLLWRNALNLDPETPVQLTFASFSGCLARSIQYRL